MGCPGGCCDISSIHPQHWQFQQRTQAAAHLRQREVIPELKEQTINSSALPKAQLFSSSYSSRLGQNNLLWGRFLSSRYGNPQGKRAAAQADFSFKESQPSEKGKNPPCYFKHSQEHSFYSQVQLIWQYQTRNPARSLLKRSVHYATRFCGQQKISLPIYKDKWYS